MILFWAMKSTHTSKEKKNKKSIMILVAILAAVLVMAACTFPAGKRITVVFRYDDLSEISATQLETDLISAFKSNGMSFTAGVIPFAYNGDQGNPALNQGDAKNIPLGPGKIEIVKSAIQEGVLEVTLHGYSHQTIPSEGGHSEFKGLDYALQYKKISEAATFLQDQLNIPITTFIPPWNRYDANTLKALNELGFSVLSANQDGIPLDSSPLLFLPNTCDDLAALQEIVVNARTSIDPHPLIVVLFHQFDILGNDVNRPQMDLAGFTSLLQWLNDQDDVEVLTLEQALAQNPGLNARRYSFNKAIRDSKMIPPMLTGIVDPLIYQSPYPLIAMIALFYLAVLLISGLIVYLVGKFIFPRSNALIWIARIAATLLLIFVVKYAFRGTQVGFRGATGVAIFAGAAIGVWWCSLRITKKAK